MREDTYGAICSDRGKRKTRFTLWTWLRLPRAVNTRCSFALYAPSVAGFVVCHSQHCGLMRRHRARTTRTDASIALLEVLKLAVEKQRLFTV
jgi:hypothetical protein